MTPTNFVSMDFETKEATEDFLKMYERDSPTLHPNAEMMLMIQTTETSWLGYQNGYLIDFSVRSHELFFSTAIWLIFFHVLASIHHRIRHNFLLSSRVPFFKKRKKKKC